MASKYDVRTSSDGQYYFNLKAANGKVILTSERYTTKANALKGIDSVRTYVAIPARFDPLTSVAGEPYSSNDEPVGRSEMYTSKNGRDNGIPSVATNDPDARVDDLTSG